MALISHEVNAKRGGHVSGNSPKRIEISQVTTTEFTNHTENGKRIKSRYCLRRIWPHRLGSSRPTLECLPPSRLILQGHSCHEPPAQRLRESLAWAGRFASARPAACFKCWSSSWGWGFVGEFFEAGGEWCWKRYPCLLFGWVMSLYSTVYTCLLLYKVFTAVDDDIEEVAVNKHMFQNVIDAHGLISPNLQFVVFPGGTRVGRMQNTAYSPC